MPKKKNAIELSINTIILAALALIVLVVLIAVFTGKSGDTVKILEDCGSRGGSCVGEDRCNAVKIPNICQDTPEGTPQICCVEIKDD
ncbi:hypothetical protein KY347_06870 [Candidatus Woesearchaeota archaeon]|nr:hypothetical protein [Candidatus Woesearchaeota archaeon]